MKCHPILVLCFCFILTGVFYTSCTNETKKTNQEEEKNSSEKASLDKSEIQKVVSAGKNDIKTCYDTQLKSKPDLAGKVEVNFEIDSKGKVSKASVGKSTMKDKTVETCIVDTVKKWTFPKPKGEGIVKVTYPFVFAPEEAKPKPKGTLDKELISKVMNDNQETIKTCYDKELKEEPHPAGSIIVNFVIEAEGNVSAATVVDKSTLRNKNIEICITDAIKKYTFPKPKGNGQVTVNYPFMFGAAN